MITQQDQSGGAMPRGDKSKYTDKEKRQAEHIEEGYEKRGVPEDEAERRAWATVNAVHGGGEKPGGGGYGKPEDHAPMRKGGRNSQQGKSSKGKSSKGKSR
jgi:plasmid stabilization system protein ParE